MCARVAFQLELGSNSQRGSSDICGLSSRWAMAAIVRSDFVLALRQLHHAERPRCIHSRPVNAETKIIGRFKVHLFIG